jgi:hypothetical protein
VWATGTQLECTKFFELNIFLKYRRMYINKKSLVSTFVNRIWWHWSCCVTYLRTLCLYYYPGSRQDRVYNSPSVLCLLQDKSEKTEYYFSLVLPADAASLS